MIEHDYHLKEIIQQPFIFFSNVGLYIMCLIFIFIISYIFRQRRKR